MSDENEEFLRQNISDLGQKMEELYQAGDTDGARKVANMIRMRQEQLPAQEKERGPIDFMGQVNVPIAETFVGLPMKVVSAFSAAQGRETMSPEEIDQFALNLTGAAKDDPEGVAENIARGIGEAAALLPITLKALGFLSKGTGIVSSVSKDMLQEFLDRPAMTAASELAAGGGMGLASEVAQQNQLGGSAQLGLEMAGAMGGGLTPYGTKYLPTGFLARKTYGLYRAMKDRDISKFIPFSHRENMEKAAEKMQRLSRNPEEAAQNVETFTAYGMTPAAATGDPTMLEWEEQILKLDPAKREQLNERTRQTIDDIEENIMGEGKIKNTTDFIQSRRERTIKAIDAHIEMAGERATLAMEQIPDADPEQLNEIIIQAMENALKASRARERELWGRIPQETKVPTASVTDRYEELVNQLSEAEKFADIMPAVARKLLGKEDVEVDGDLVENLGVEVGEQFDLIGLFDEAGEATVLDSVLGEETTVRELDGLYRVLGGIAAKARSDKNFQQAYIAEELREAIWDDLGNAIGDDAVRETVASARAHSKHLNEKFNKGVAGRILGVNREGLTKIDPLKVLQTTVGTRGVTGESARRQIVAAVDQDPTVLDAIQNFFRSQFNREVVDESGNVNPFRARAFLNKHKEILESFPQLKNQLEVAKTTEDALRRVTDRGTSWKRSIEGDNIAVASNFVGENINKRISKLMGSDNPITDMKNLVRLSRKNKAALDGIKNATAKWLLKSSGINKNGFPNATQLNKTLRDPVLNKTLREVFDDLEIQRLFELNEALLRIQRQQEGQGRAVSSAVQADVKPRPNWVLDKVAGITGAITGTELLKSVTTRVSIQVPAIFSKSFRDVYSKMTRDKAYEFMADAVEDPKLFNVLMNWQPQATTQTLGDKKRAAYFKEWLENNGLRFLSQETLPLRSELIDEEEE